MNLKKFLSSAAVVGAVFAAGSASALPAFNEFTVNPGNFGVAGFVNPFVADKMTGSYLERLTIVDGSNFQVSLKVNILGFSVNDGSTSISSFDSGLGGKYQLYALFQSNGTYSTSGGATTFNLTPASGLGLQLWLDPVSGSGPASGLTSLGATTSSGLGDTYFTVSGNLDDILLATGTGASGIGNLSCTLGPNCGSFGQVTTLNLTPTLGGVDFFTSPSPFFNLAFQSGAFNGFAVLPGTSQTLNGSLDIFFPVPEPSALALVGVALLGLGLARRSSKV